MNGPVQMILGVAKDRPDPRAISTWLNAYLGTRPLQAKHAALTALEAQLRAMSPPPDPRHAGLILRVIENVRATLK